MIVAARHILKHSIRARLIAMTGAIVVAVVCLLTCVMALLGANSLRQESDVQLAQSLRQSAALLSNFLDVRESALDQWAVHPLVDAMFGDPEVAGIFVPNLHNFFSKIRGQEPWLSQVFLIQDQQVIYSDDQRFEFSRDGNGVAAGLELIARLPARGASVLDLRRLRAGPSQQVLLLKRPVLKDGRPLPGASVVLLLDFGQIQQKLFGQLQIGHSGFVSIAASDLSGRVVLPLQPGFSSAERSDFWKASAAWRSWSDIPERYGSIAFRRQHLDGTPFAIVGVASRDDIRASVLRLVLLAGALGLLALVFGICCAIYFAGRLTGPILTLTLKAEQLARYHAGESDDAAPAGKMPKLDGLDRHDELGRLAHSFARMQAAIHDKIALIENQNQLLTTKDAQTQELNQSLERKVLERTGQLQQALRAQQAVSEQLQEKNRELDRLSITDRLTGLCNRLRLDQVLDDEIKRYQRCGNPFSLMLLDVDHFKRVNDTFGHQAGDIVLAEMADLLAKGTRAVDVVGRWGGEEFLLVCRDTELEGAALLAEKLREQIAGHVFRVGGGKTCSFGVTSVVADDTLAQMIARADRALYRSKAGGRNRVELEAGQRNGQAAASDLASAADQSGQVPA
ncbi:diguanylate cyclase [Rugamonas sp. CCM 8940]|uniref:GGDEF domain-containing protein n=1 Tax=Rugamonas sp. CCM 8940 TaxID=2765359 RepID=UPI0018F6D29A|nr:sensor domain-containing diguanylate cyclase [Rugamonas sp. CCM 8940]MBJ7312783.1 sensor domain-containing diguanylate cyclase [Rugamonas sp. CCM 8940]